MSDGEPRYPMPWLFLKGKAAGIPVCTSPVTHSEGRRRKGSGEIPWCMSVGRDPRGTRLEPEGHCVSCVFITVSHLLEHSLRLFFVLYAIETIEVYLYSI